MGHETRPHVLIIDDHQEFAKKLAHFIERAGFQASCALSGSDGIGAFDAALSAGTPFAAVVTDFSMPDVDGLAVAAAVKGASATTPVVLLTFHPVDSDDDLPSHVDCVLRKPPSPALLGSTLASLIFARESGP